MIVTESGMRTIGTGDQTIPVIRLVGTPRQRGLQRGALMRDMISRRVTRILEAYAALGPRPVLLRLANEAEAAIARRHPRVLEELRAMAEGAELAWDDLRIASLVRTVGFQAAIGSKVNLDDCLCVVASKGATRDGRPLLGKNADYVTSVSTTDDLFVMEVIPDRGFAHVGVGVYPEKVCQPEGMNERGLAIVGAGQYPRDGADAFAEGRPTGADIYHLYGDILTDCATVSDAIEVIQEGPHGYTGRVMILADDTAAWAKVEITHELSRVLGPDAEAHASSQLDAGTSGVFSARETQELITTRSDWPAAYRRYDHVMDLLSRSAGQIDLARIIAILRDHYDGPGLSSPCKHVDPAVVPNVKPLEALPTKSAVVFEPAARRVWVTKGAPCVSDFIPLEVPAGAAVG